MPALAALIILVTTLITSFISGIFGMAGGIILMAVLVALVSVAVVLSVYGLRESGSLWALVAGPALACLLGAAFCLRLGGRRDAARMLSKVDLPQPDGPIIETNSPS